MRFFLVLLAAIFIGANAQHSDDHSVTTTVHPGHHDHNTPAPTPSSNGQHLGREVAELLVMRGEQIIKRAEDQIAEIVKMGGDNLVFTLKNEVALAEQMVTSIRQELAEGKNIDIHRLHEYEEMLLHVENRLSDELRVIEEVKKHPEQHIKVESLIEQAEKIEKEAKEVLHKFGEHSNNKIASAIHNELHALNELAAELKHHPKGSELLKEAVQMAKHEITLRQLLAKAEDELKHSPHH